MKKKNKKFIWIVIAIAALYFLYKKLNGKFHFANSSEKITINKGDTFELTFPWNTSTGPSAWWTFDNENEIDIVEKIDENYQPDERSRPQTIEILGKTTTITPIGIGGDKTFIYKAVKKGYQVMHWTRGKGTMEEIVRTIGIHVE